MTRAISIVASCMSETPMSQASRGPGVHLRSWLPACVRDHPAVTCPGFAAPSIVLASTTINTSAPSIVRDMTFREGEDPYPVEVESAIFERSDVADCTVVVTASRAR